MNPEGLSREMKHVSIAYAIKRLHDIITRIDALINKIDGSVEAKTPGTGTGENGLIERTPSLAEFFTNTPERLEKIRAEVIEKIQVIEERIF